VWYARKLSAYGRDLEVTWKAPPIDFISLQVSYVDSLVDFVVVIFGCNQSYSFCTKNRRKRIQTTSIKLLVFHKS
jgi:hypothetical protein